MIQMQKVIKVGNSLAVTIDKKQAQLMKIEPGQSMAVVYKPEKDIISMSQTKKGVSALTTTHKAAENEAVMAAKITPELKEWTDAFLEENKEALERLADL